MHLSSLVVTVHNSICPKDFDVIGLKEKRPFEVSLSSSLSSFASPEEQNTMGTFQSLLCQYVISRGTKVNSFQDHEKWCYVGLKQIDHKRIGLKKCSKENWSKTELV